LKRFILGLICGIGLTATTAVYASDTIQTYLFPAKFAFNGVTKEVDNKEYVVLNHQGHAYVPIRFVAENMGALVKYEESTKTIILNETSLSKKLQLNEAILNAVKQGKLPGIEFGIGAAKKDVFETWGEPQRTGSRGAHFDAWFDYNYFFTNPDQTVRLIGISGDTIKYSVEEVKKALGQPSYEGLGMIVEGWEMSYVFDEYGLYFEADKKDGTVQWLGLGRLN
jgi:hypothetical protein